MNVQRINNQPAFTAKPWMIINENKIKPEVLADIKGAFSKLDQIGDDTVEFSIGNIEGVKDSLTMFCTRLIGEAPNQKRVLATTTSEEFNPSHPPFGPQGEKMTADSLFKEIKSFYNDLVEGKEPTNYSATEDMFM